MALVQMHHDDPVATAGPTTADVPEEAVERWEKIGWYLLPEDKAKLEAKRAKAAKSKAKAEAKPEPKPEDGGK